MPNCPYFEIHSFADPDRSFSGNPAGVALLERFPDDEEMLGIANSNNLSETAFLVPAETDVWHLRWFTPTVEVDLCGHATLAAAAVVFEQDLVTSGLASFITRSGRLEVEQDGDRLCMNFPRVGFQPTAPSDVIKTALGLDDDPVEVVEIDRIHGAKYQMWVVTDQDIVATLEPDYSVLKRLNTNIIITAPGTSVDFVSRFFAPVSGVDEDPVTGSAHCTLAPYWADRLGKPLMSARQIGPRPGVLEVESKGERVSLSGHASHYLSGEIKF
ncbi:MAG: PhzF family phenazine biosynthesis protein [Maricaulis sp.]|jgi:PhzF family phenazine biosynthesis protein|nr:PhzF family phenazine biosynthesis protein [Maricaulis sp.]MDG2043561.1 PhzF family phenazine biosynthesis protein [Maricaulis sp.]